MPEYQTHSVQDVAAEAGLTEREMFAFLRDCGLIDRTHSNNRPTTKARHRGWLVGRATEYTRGADSAHREQYVRPLFTPRGRAAMLQMLTWRDRRAPFAEHYHAIAHTLLDTEPRETPDAPPPDYPARLAIALGDLHRALDAGDKPAASAAMGRALAALMAWGAQKNLEPARHLLALADTQQKR